MVIVHYMLPVGISPSRVTHELNGKHDKLKYAFAFFAIHSISFALCIEVRL